MKVEIDLYSPEEFTLFSAFLLSLSDLKQQGKQAFADRAMTQAELVAEVEAHKAKLNTARGRGLSIVKTDAPGGAA